MEDYLKQAIEIVKAQASVRNMNEDEITSMIRALTQSIRGVAEGVVPVATPNPPWIPRTPSVKRASSAANAASPSRS